MAQTTIKKKKLNELTLVLEKIDYQTKNLLSIRCEKLGNNLGELAQKANDEIMQARQEFASTDEKGNFIYEQVTVADKAGISRTENSGNFKYTHKRRKEMDNAIERILESNISIPTYVIPRHGNEALYKEIFKKYSPSTISSLAGIILDVPLDEDNFVKEEFVLEMTAELKPEINGQAKEEITS